MRLPRVRIMLRELMLGIAVVGLLFSFPAEMLVLVLISLFFWSGIVVVCVLSLESLGGAICSVGLALAVLFACAAIVAVFLPFILGPLEAVFLGLTLTNAIGPVYLAWKIRHKRPPFAGEILWAWLGALWTMVWLTRNPHDFDRSVSLMAQATQLSLVVALLLIRFCKRPQSPDRRWPHYLGWALFECDAIVWGWYALRFLLRIGYIW